MPRTADGSGGGGADARLGRNAQAALSYEAAIARTENGTERDFLQRRRQALTRAIARRTR